jgi:hypothetical protein
LVENKVNQFTAARTPYEPGLHKAVHVSRHYVFAVKLVLIMAVFIYGHSSTPIGIDQITLRCPSCERDTENDLLVESQYFHIFWIPIFPFDKIANVTCHECGLRRTSLPFNKNIFPTYNQIKRSFAHPFRTYAFVLCIISFIAIAVIIDYYEKPKG